MLIYENARPNTYEEIKTWYPVWYREIFEMDALWRVFGGQMDQIRADIIQMTQNNFIKFADAPTVTRLEAFFGIKHPTQRTLVERRAVLIGFVRGRGRIGRPQIIEIISLFTSGKIDVTFSRPGSITITVTRDFGDMFNLSDIHMILGHRIPAHLTLGMIDKPYPVRVTNQNSFRLLDLLMLRFRVRNITAPGEWDGSWLLDGTRLLDGSWALVLGSVHGINAIDFHVKARFRNYGELPEIARLDTRNLVSLRGMSTTDLDIGIFKLANDSKLTAGTTFPIRLQNANSLQMPSLDIKATVAIVKKGIRLDGRRGLDRRRGLDGSWHLSSWEHLMRGLTAQHLNIGTMQFATNNRLSTGVLEQSRLWGLDGELVLDGGISTGGEQTLERLTIKEVLT